MARIGGRNLSSTLSGRLGNKGFVTKSRLGDKTGGIRRGNASSSSVHSRLGLQGKRQSSVNVKVQRARERVINNHLQNRSDSRRNKFNERRGLDIDRNKTFRRADSPVSYRISNGTVVGGLRSDQLLLQKKRVRDNPGLSRSRSRDYSVWESNETYATDEHDERNESLASMINSGLTVSFKNNQLSDKRSRQHISTTGSRSAPARERYMYDDELSPERPSYNMYSDRGPQSAVYVPPVYYDDVYMLTGPESSPEPMYHQGRVCASPEQTNFLKKTYQVSPSPSPPPKPIHIPSTSKKSSKSLKASSKQSSKLHMPLVTVLNDRPAPKPHRPTLDPKVQKEIALLQGKPTAKLDSAPGPGLKGFRIVPTQTTTRLSERFTQDKTAPVL